MNALDFLVDFAALVSTSETSRPGHDGNNVDRNIDPMRSKVELALEMSARPPETLPCVNKEPLVNTARLRSNMASSSPQHTFSAYMVDHSNSNTHAHGPYEEMLAFPPEPHISLSFDQFLHQHPGLGLPFATVNDVSCLACDCQRLTHWVPNHEMGYLLPTKPASWNHVQPYHQLPNHDTRSLETQFVHPVEETRIQPSHCMDAACHCQYTPPHHHAASNDYAPVFPAHVWGPHASVYDKSFWKEDEGWTWKC